MLSLDESVVVVQTILPIPTHICIVWSICPLDLYHLPFISHIYPLRYKQFDGSFSRYTLPFAKLIWFLLFCSTWGRSVSFDLVMIF